MTLTVNGVEVTVRGCPVDRNEVLSKQLEDGSIVVGFLAHDEDCQNPCKDGDGVGQIRSLSNRHIDRIDIDEATEMLKSDKMVVALSYYEHGLCLWDVCSGERIGRCPDQQWDQVSFAGIWAPDECCRDEIKSRSHRKHIPYQAAARELAKECCTTYTDWANGSCYGYVVTTFDETGREVNHDSCWGFIGYEYAHAQLEEAFESACQRQLNPQI